MIDLISPDSGQYLNCDEASCQSDSGEQFPIIDGVCRFVKQDNYASNFGFQWNLFAQVQLDHFSGSGITSERFFKATGWKSKELKNKTVLEAGCGAGRFTSVVLNETEAELYSFDYSDSVTANFKNHGSNKLLHLYQASIYEMPFAENSFDYAFCFGVLQFTPDPRKAVEALIKVVKPGGQLVVDFFPKKGWWTKIHAKYLLRPWTSKVPHEKLLQWIEGNVDWMMRVYQLFYRLGLNATVNRFLPICDIENTIPKNLPNEERRQWIVLDTFNMLSPAYDQPQRMKDVVQWFKEAGMKEVKGEVVAYGDQNHVQVVRGIKA